MPRLRFETLPAAIAYAEQLVAASERAPLASRGNWSLGQALGHLAYWANAPFDGYPALPKPPLPMRLLIKLLRNRILNVGMTTGVKLPGVPGGTYGTEDMPAREGLARLSSAFTRIDERDPAIPNPVFGPMTHKEWKKINLRHAELHLGMFERAT
jgi:hypothetical protein